MTTSYIFAKAFSLMQQGKRIKLHKEPNKPWTVEIINKSVGEK